MRYASHSLGWQFLKRKEGKKKGGKEEKPGQECEETETHIHC